MRRYVAIVLGLLVCVCGCGKSEKAIEEEAYKAERARLRGVEQAWCDHYMERHPEVAAKIRAHIAEAERKERAAKSATAAPAQ